MDPTTSHLHRGRQLLLTLSVMAVVFALTACGGGYSKSNRAAATTTAPAASAVATLASSAATIQVRPTSAGGSLLTSADGKTLYTFDHDTPGVSTCTGGCASTWPPLAQAAGTLVTPAGLSGTLSSLTRPDGSKQVAYDSRPLYHYAGDSQPGDTKGDGVGGLWHVAQPVGPAPSPTSKPPSYPAY